MSDEEKKQSCHFDIRMNIVMPSGYLFYTINSKVNELEYKPVLRSEIKKPKNNKVHWNRVFTDKDLLGGPDSEVMI